MILPLLLVMLAGWANRAQQQVIMYLNEENRLKAQRRGRRLRLTDTERRRLAALGHMLGRRHLTGVTTITRRMPSPW
jgi:hypothetical protein